MHAGACSRDPPHAHPRSTPPQLVGSFNETDIRDKAWWNRDFRALTNGDVTKLREAHRARLRALQ